jgi:hypothetical protein
VKPAALSKRVTVRAVVKKALMTVVRRVVINVVKLILSRQSRKRRAVSKR